MLSGGDGLCFGENHLRRRNMLERHHFLVRPRGAEEVGVGPHRILEHLVVDLRL